MALSMFKRQITSWRRSFYLACVLYGISWLLGIIITIKFAPQQTLQQLLIVPSQTHNAWYYISHNIGVEGLLLCGACTLGIGTGLVLCVNGLLDGILSTAIALHYGLGVLLAGLLPHGIFEACAWILISACGFLLSNRFKSVVASLWSSKNTVKSADEVVVIHAETTSMPQTNHIRDVYFALIITSTLLLVLAGIIEAYISPMLILIVK
jgi:uncharacterized membrane protein SpoIIM required for sporulation